MAAINRYTMTSANNEDAVFCGVGCGSTRLAQICLSQFLGRCVRGPPSRTEERSALDSHVGKPSSAYGWSSVIFFLFFFCFFFRVFLRFSPTFDERSARYT